eukprot:scaffold39763_cov250-Skeletonema_dohrnii-CCMP3373.AAC.1
MEEHGAKVERCSTEGCRNQNVDGGMCRGHGAKRACSADGDGCTNRLSKRMSLYQAWDNVCNMNVFRIA